MKTEKNQYGLIRSVYVERKTTVGYHQYVLLDVKAQIVTNLIVHLAKVSEVIFNFEYCCTPYIYMHAE